MQQIGANGIEQTKMQHVKWTDNKTKQHKENFSLCCFYCRIKVCAVAKNHYKTNL